MYLGKYISTYHASLIIAVTDIFVAMITVTVIFPLVLTLGLEPALDIWLAFTVLPQAFDLVPFSQFWP